MSQALAQFEVNKQDVEDLLGFHSKLSGAKRGRRPPEHQILNKSAILFCAAIWEAYIEDLVEESLNHLATHCSNRSKLPPYLVGEIEKHSQGVIKGDASKLWDFASKSLGDLLRDNAKRVANTLPKTGSEFNTAKTAQVSSLISSTLGLEKIEDQWLWSKMTASSAQTKLDESISLRGDLAHGNKDLGAVRKDAAKRMKNHIERLVKKTDKLVSTHLKTITGVDL